PHLHIDHKDTAGFASQMSVQRRKQVASDEVVLLTGARHRIHVPGEILMPGFALQLARQIIIHRDRSEFFRRFHCVKYWAMRQCWQACLAALNASGWLESSFS